MSWNFSFWLSLAPNGRFIIGFPMIYTKFVHGVSFSEEFAFYAFIDHRNKGILKHLTQITQLKRTVAFLFNLWKVLSFWFFSALFFFQQASSLFKTQLQYASLQSYNALLFNSINNFNENWNRKTNCSWIYSANTSENHHVKTDAPNVWSKWKRWRQLCMPNQFLTISLLKSNEEARCISFSLSEVRKR